MLGLECLANVLKNKYFKTKWILNPDITNVCLEIFFNSFFAFIFYFLFETQKQGPHSPIDITRLMDLKCLE